MILFNNNQKGFSLLEGMMTAAILGGLGMFVMSLSKMGLKSSSEMQASTDVAELKREVSLILSNPRACEASLKNTTFLGSQIATTPVTGLELWSANQVGARANKKFFSPLNYGKLKIDSISFKMPDYTAGVNFPDGTGQRFNGEITIQAGKRIMGNTINLQEIKQTVLLTFNSASGTSTITACQGASGVSASQITWF